MLAGEGTSAQTCQWGKLNYCMGEGAGGGGGGGLD